MKHYFYLWNTNSNALVTIATKKPYLNVLHTSFFPFKRSVPNIQLQKIYWMNANESVQLLFSLFMGNLKVASKEKGMKDCQRYFLIVENFLLK